MKSAEKKELLKNPEVIEEIGRHLWLESEKAGHNIGFDRAAEDWFEHYADAWKDYYLPESKPVLKKTTGNKSAKVSSNGAGKIIVKKVVVKAKNRRAKSYN